jgi:ATP-dependent exoDNAse (exonuclease V) beta subunit
MSQIEIISASAGSGKTTRIAKSLADGVDQKLVQSDSVLATTFTVKASAELAERVRGRLLSSGKTAEAHGLSAARIGTVNSICQRLVAEFAFLIGLSPVLSVLDEETADVAFRRSLAEVLSESEEDELSFLTERLGEGFDWQQAVGQMVRLARYNNIPATDLAKCSRRSEEEFLKLFGEASGLSTHQLEKDLLDALTAFPDEVDSADETGITKDAIQRVENDLRRLRQEHFLAWSEWGGLAKLAVGKKSEKAARIVSTAAAAQDTHPQLHRDVRRAIQLVFGLAERSMMAYEDHKKDIGALDFTDQECYALKLLDIKEVQDFISEKLDLLLVDEFQDTSPIQLAVFLRLARLATRSVWVGDQKQSIYGFRGTDPVLMDAAISEITASGSVDTLGTSYRSRPGLVELTSSLFAPAFAGWGIPEDRVRLKPHLAKDPPGLGPFLQYWKLASSKYEEAAGAAASAIQEFLADNKEKIRDPASRDVRSVRPGDIAILCRKNDTCEAIAKALENQGIRATLPRKKLMRTPEARLVMAGLRIWVDPRDTLAKAEVARLVEHAKSPDAWFEVVLKNKENDFKTLDAGIGVKQILEASQNERHLGALAVWDRVVEILEMRNLCHRWGDTVHRLSNLEALRALAAKYLESERTQDESRTSAGLVRHLAKLAKAKQDSQGVALDENSVVVSTWHSAKGLEWPVVVLFELPEKERHNLSLGVQVANENPKVDLSQPLQGRWIRYWPNPYWLLQTGLPFHERLSKREEDLAAKQSENSEALRLLYVRWTRARDILAIATMKGKFNKCGLSLLDVDGAHPLEEPKQGVAHWGGQEVKVKIREAAPKPALNNAVNAVSDYMPSGPQTFAPAFIRPSVDAEAIMDSGNERYLTGSEISQHILSADRRLIRIGKRIIVLGKEGWDILGSAIHAFLRADRESLSPEQRLDLAESILIRFGVAERLAPPRLLQSSLDLHAWANSNWPGAKWHREWPISHSLDSGSIVRGSADLVLETSNGFLVIDHKSFPGSDTEGVERALTFVDQLRMYGEAISAATNRKKLGSYVHLPLLGLVIVME